MAIKKSPNKSGGNEQADLFSNPVEMDIVEVK